MDAICEEGSFRPLPAPPDWGPCSAFPFFERKIVKTDKGDLVELIDGGYCAINPTLYAIADAIMALKLPPEYLRVVSVGVGAYPAPKQSWFSTTKWAQKLLTFNPP